MTRTPIWIIATLFCGQITAASSTENISAKLTELRTCQSVVRKVDGAPPNLPTEGRYKVQDAMNVDGYGFYIQVDGCDKNKSFRTILTSPTDTYSVQFYALKIFDGPSYDFVVRAGIDEYIDYYLYSSAGRYKEYLLVSVGGEVKIERVAGHDQFHASGITKAFCSNGKRANLKLNSGTMVPITSSVCR